jgi:uncharacterized membrane protein
LNTTVKRFELLDIIRGIAILAMILHHTAYDLVAFYGIKIPILDTVYFSIIQFVFAGSFILVAGITSNFSRSNIRRGLYCIAAGVIVTVASLLVSPDYPIYFGILQFMGVSMLLYGFFGKYFKKIPDKIGGPLWAGMFFIHYFIYSAMGRVNIEYLFPLGLIPYDFSAGDYYPLFPYFWLFLLGTVVGRMILDGKLPDWFYRVKRVPFLSFVGRNTLLLYLLHQPAVYLLLWLIFQKPF